MQHEVRDTASLCASETSHTHQLLQIGSLADVRSDGCYRAIGASRVVLKECRGRLGQLRGWESLLDEETKGLHWRTCTTPLDSATVIHWEMVSFRVVRAPNWDWTTGLPSKHYPPRPKNPPVQHPIRLQIQYCLLSSWIAEALLQHAVHYHHHQYGVYTRRPGVNSYTVHEHQQTIVVSGTLDDGMRPLTFTACAAQAFSCSAIVSYEPEENRDQPSKAREMGRCLPPDVHFNPTCHVSRHGVLPEEGERYSGRRRQPPEPPEPHAPPENNPPPEIHTLPANLEMPLRQGLRRRQPDPLPPQGARAVRLHVAGGVGAPALPAGVSVAVPPPAASASRKSRNGIVWLLCALQILRVRYPVTVQERVTLTG
ncbi:uncharacterized protein BO66DRAFT_401905 [Aspergillus aculeatinus CBS 121060]|uniref:Uncharacterized protein n=1 Tax=Aspergillus aculeatinus CBS 121060 TaxID=1448322 RepID=A0ACD1H906_9EURO|nr:hypothetical protein BO66DRAFT_401905 [Aspergillus aculeatinus CBS 121060]RAH69879.1 hypothetical protein BO66DRAFT_401905 [Aspergillus aculeatinus CBS 121060]